MKKIYSIILIIISLNAFAQKRNLFSKSDAVVSAQFAGSVGFASVGYHRNYCHDKLMLGLVYGNTPARFGGNLHSVSIKFSYAPFRIPIYNSISINPILAGFFIAQNMGENLRWNWPKRYKGGYYWWGNSLRQHVFVSSKINVAIKKGIFRQLGMYLEANTNDLYVYSYLSNMQSLKFYDIVFFGVGVQATLK